MQLNPVPCSGAPLLPQAGIAGVFQRIDAATHAFQAETGLSCPEGCGKCCLSPEVETTVAEVLPLARELFRRGEAEAVHEKLVADPAPASCVFYRYEEGNPERGQCGMYAWRPSLCRLFAYAGGRGKDGKPRLAGCAVQRSSDPKLMLAAEQAAATTEGLLPLFPVFSTAVASVDPELGSEHLPINTAVRLAIERVGIRLEYATPVVEAESPTEEPDPVSPAPQPPCKVA